MTECELCEAPAEFTVKAEYFTYWLCHIHVDCIKKIVWEMKPSREPIVTPIPLVIA